MKRLFLQLGLLGLLLAMAPSCSNQVWAKHRVAYRFEYGKTALYRNGKAYAPRNAPRAVHRAIAAGNRLQNKPYKWGGGHRRLDDSGYDCSGAVSYVLREAGLLRGQMVSKGFFQYGQPGMGRWITVYVRKGHVFIVVAGLRLDTGGGSRTGPRWKPESRSAKGHAMRHPRGL